jgi:hypothetical protein
LRRWPDLKFSRDKFHGNIPAEILRDLTISYIAVASENVPSLAENPSGKYFRAVCTEIICYIRDIQNPFSSIKIRLKKCDSHVAKKKDFSKIIKL